MSKCDTNICRDKVYGRGKLRDTKQRVTNIWLGKASESACVGTVTNHKLAAGAGVALKQNAMEHLTNSLLHIFRDMVYGWGQLW